MSDENTERVNPVAGMHKAELVAAVEAATPAELHQLDADCHAHGWSVGGEVRSRIARRLAEALNAPATITEG